MERRGKKNRSNVASTEAFTSLADDTLKTWAEAMGSLDTSEGVVDDDVSSLEGITVGDYMAMAELTSEDDVSSESFLSKLSALGLHGLWRAGRLVLPAPLRVLLTLSGVALGVGLVGLVGFAFFKALSFVGRGSSLQLDKISLQSLGTVGGVSLGAEGRQGVAESLYSRLVGSSRTVAQGRLITSDFGVREGVRGDVEHTGIDFGMPEGTQLRWPLAMRGEVMSVWSDSQGGRSLRIRAADGSMWGFAHLSRNDVLRVGDKVSEGDVIAYSGNTGHSTGAHLHLSYSKGMTGKKSDPLAGYSAAEGYSSPVALGFNGYKAGSLRADNNITNIQSSGIAWHGATGSARASMGRSFVSFESPIYALRATGMTIKNYQLRKDISRSGGSWTTIGDISRMFVGGSMSGEAAYAGDDLSGWARAVSSMSGYGVNEHIDVSDVDVLSRLLPAVARQETGSYVPQAMARQAAEMSIVTSDNGCNIQSGGVYENIQKY